MTDSVAPPKSGNAKYVVVGLLLLIATAAMFSLLSSTPDPEPQAKAAAPAPPPKAERVNPMAEPALILDEPEPEPEPEPVVAEKKKVRQPGPGVWDCEGDLDRAALSQVMGSAQAPVRACYEHQLKTNNMLQGSVQVKVKVNGTGKVIKTATSGTLKSKEVLSCIRRLAGEWKFPAPTEGNCAVVQVPFQFSPKN